MYYIFFIGIDFLPCYKSAVIYLIKYFLFSPLLQICWNRCAKCGVSISFPPKKGAVLWKHKSKKQLAHLKPQNIKILTNTHTQKDTNTHAHIKDDLISGMRFKLAQPTVDIKQQKIHSSYFFDYWSLGIQGIFNKRMFSQIFALKCGLKTTTVAIYI